MSKGDGTKVGNGFREVRAQRPERRNEGQRQKGFDRGRDSKATGKGSSRKEEKEAEERVKGS